jgi:ABC-2 type transport system permease protein
MKIKPYLSILRIKLIAGLQYRTVALAGLAINLFYGLILTTILLLFYRLGKNQNASMTIQQGVTYIWLAQCFINLIPLGLDSEVYQKITSGDFAYELCRPLDLYWHWFARASAMRLSNTALKSGLGLIVCALLPAPYGIQAPASFLSLLAAILSLIAALLLSCSFTNLANTFLLQVELGPGINNLLNALITIFSGMLVPLALFPDWLQPFLRMLPFAGLMDFPLELYIGLIPYSDLFFVLARQIFWIVALVLLGRWRLKKGLQRTVVQGG